VSRRRPMLKRWKTCTLSMIRRWPMLKDTNRCGGNLMRRCATRRLVVNTRY
jgi:hypothetical protein